MSPQSEARNKIRDEFGRTVAEKASEAFVDLYAAAAASPFAVEAKGSAPGAPVPRVPTILEMQPRAPARGLGTISKDALAAAQSATAEVLRQIGEERAELFAISALRRRAVERSRDEFLLECGAVLDELGKVSSGASGAPSEDTMRMPQAPVVEACWLNDTIRTTADPRTVAAVADDPRVRVIDVPRLLFKEINATCALLGAPAFRKANAVTGGGVNVAVIDSEVSRQHVGIGPRVIHKANFTREPWGNPDSHGTAVAGIIGAASDRLFGMAPEVTIFNYKVLATVDALNADDFGGALALQQALEDGAHVANCSWGTGPASDGSSREARACDTAWALGLIIVKSAGNRGPGASTITTPADAEGVIAVGATDRRGHAVQPYSSRGPFRNAAGRTVSRPHVVAPGGTERDPITSCTVSGGFGFCGHGTSFAAPHVTGLIALLLNLRPGNTPDEIRQEVIGRCRVLWGFGENDQGAGLTRL
jgi:serine protease AprX